MSNEIMNLAPGAAEVAYRREQLLADADRRRLLRTAKAANAARAAHAPKAAHAATPATTDRRTRRPGLLDRFLRPVRRIVAARSAPVRQAGPTPLWR